MSESENRLLVICKDNEYSLF